MKINQLIIDRLVRRVLNDLTLQKIMEPKATEEKIFKSAVLAIQKELEKEREVEREAQRMLEDLERQNPNGFERHKMFLMLKKKIAEERKVVL